MTIYLYLLNGVMTPARTRTLAESYAAIHGSKVFKVEGVAKPVKDSCPETPTKE